tara:strand:+ start:999 stop:1853 length:855 start_codon:yes stop_codon:yes gene_type:complete
MEIFNDLKSKNYNYSSKIESNKYTQSKWTGGDTEKSVIKETSNHTMGSVENESLQHALDGQILKSVKNESLQHAVDNECVKYTKQVMIKKYKTLYELILSIKDHNYTILEENEKDKYVSEQKMLLCSKVDDEYETYNFNKRILSKSLICSNLQKNKDNLLSLILFYNDYFNINLIICHDNKFYKTGLKNYDNIYIKYTKYGWVIININVDNIEYENILDFKYGIELDLKTNFIYNQYLKAISNYKSDELINISKELNIDLLKVDGKKKIKKDLYEEINILKLYN